MIPFLIAQAGDPFDPAPMLIQADWLEERGDLAGAEALRGLAGAGIPSIVALTQSVGLFSAADDADRLDPRGVFHGTRDGSAIGSGAGDQLGVGHGQGHGWPEGYEITTGNHIDPNGVGEGEWDRDGGDLP